MGKRRSEEVLFLGGKGGFEGGAGMVEFCCDIEYGQ